jgi:clan AA aspartic protease
MLQVKGEVRDRAEERVELRLLAGMEVECLVDTGYVGGALVLPQSVVDQLGLPVIDHEKFRMVSGARGSADIAVAQIERLGEVRWVEVLIQEDFIIGTTLLEGTEVLINYKARTLTIRCIEEIAT